MIDTMTYHNGHYCSASRIPHWTNQDSYVARYGTKVHSEKGRI